MNTQSTYLEKPSLVNVIAWTTLASGIVNLGWGLVVSATSLLTIVGICCTPLTILPAILGIFEIIYAAKLLSTPPQPVRPATNLAILEIVCILTGNVFSMIVGILSLIFYNDPAVKNYFTRLNSDVTLGTATQIPPVTPLVTSAPMEEPFPSPIFGEEPVAPVEEIHFSEPEPPVPPAPPSATDDTIVSPFPGEEPPAASDEPNPPQRPIE